MLRVDAWWINWSHGEHLAVLCVLASKVDMTCSNAFPSQNDADPVPAFLRDWLVVFLPCFTAVSWEHVLVLVMGAVLAPGKRTVTACLRMTGRTQDMHFVRDHHVLSRARWSPRMLARHLVSLLVTRLIPEGPIIIGLDDTIERRWGARLTARGIYRDPARSSHGHFVKTSGLRWLSFMVLVPLPWFQGVKALPVLTLLAPSERASAIMGHRHKRLTDRARQGILQIMRWRAGTSDHLCWRQRLCHP